MTRRIAGRKLSEEALRESEEKFRALTESTSDWIWEINRNGVYTYSSPKITEILGYEPAEVLGRTPFDLMPAEEAARLRPQVGSIIAARGLFHRLENAARHKDGRLIVLETSGVPIFDKNGQWQGYRGIDRDITGRKEAEVRLIRSEVRLRAIFERSGTGITIISMDRKIQQVNPAFASFLGYTEGELLGKNVADISHPDDDAINIGQYQGMLQGRFDHFHMEKRYYRKDGSIVWGLLTVTLMHGADGRPEFIVGMIEDITGRKQAEQALEDMNRTLHARIQDEVAKNREKDRLMMVQSRQAAMGEMLGNIAHQWRQPLNIVGLIIQDIYDAQAHGQLTQEYLEKSVRRGMDVIQLMSQTIDDFRGFYRVDKEKQTFFLNEIVDRVLAFVEAGFRNNQIDIEVKMPEAVAATGYPNEFAQVLLNILNNAKDALLERRVPSPKLAIRVFRDLGRSVVTIADNAGGIADGDLDRVFEPFFTTKEEGKGTGIGLYMSKHIIEKNMSGRLTARNTAEGAEFRIEV
jgi:two-component system C4-dicarboxylate transport sensor histidine kinase DctB